MPRWTAPRNEEPHGPAHPGPPSLAFGRRPRPPHEILFDGLEHLSAQIEQLESEVARLRQLVEAGETHPRDESQDNA